MPPLHGFSRTEPAGANSVKRRKHPPCQPPVRLLAPVRILVACLFAPVCPGWAVHAAPRVSSVPARFFVELRVGEARLRLEAEEFLAVEMAGEKQLLPKALRAVFSGSNRSVHTLDGEGEAPGSWLSRHEVQERFDERMEVRLELPAGPDWEELIRGAPLRIRIGPGPQPLVEVMALSPEKGKAPVPGWSVVRSGESVRTDRVTARTLQQGRWVESAPVTGKSVLQPRYSLAIGSGREGRSLRHGRISGPEFVFEDEDLRIPRALSASRLIAGGEVLTRTVSEALPGVSGGFGEMAVQIRWELSLGQPPDVGWFGPVAAAKETGRWPEMGGKLPFVIRLTRPGLVEELELGLAGVSRHPGVAGNGGAVLLSRPPGWRDKVRRVPVDFREEDFSLSWTRSEVIVPTSPIDSGPDLSLEAADHPGFVVDRNGTGNLRLGRDQVREEIPVQVTVADWGAGGQLVVRVKVEGIWEELPARSGDGAAPAPALKIPTGAGPDGVPPGFGSGAEDADGDGLSRAEEWRGLIVDGRHRRLSPERREVFLTDPGDCLGEEERIALQRRFSPWDIDLIFLGPGETAMKEVLVVEDLRAHFLPALQRLEDEAAQRKALRAIRPRPGCPGLFTDGQADPVPLAGDLARILGLAEFGPES